MAKMAAVHRQVGGAAIVWLPSRKSDKGWCTISTKNYISSVALMGDAIVTFGGATLRSVLPKSGKKSAVIVFTTDPKKDDAPALFVDMTTTNHEVLRTTAKVVNDGRNLVVKIVTQTLFNGRTGKAYEAIQGFATVTDEEAEVLAIAAEEAAAARLASRSQERLSEASQFLIKPQDKSAT